MNSAEVLRRLYREKKDWKSYGTSSLALDTLKGIDICISHVKGILKEQTINERLRKPCISRLYARDLYRTIQTAVHRLKTGDGKRALRDLEKALETCRPRTAEFPRDYSETYPSRTLKEPVKQG